MASISSLATGLLFVGLLSSPAHGFHSGSSADPAARNTVEIVNGYPLGRDTLGVWHDQCSNDTTTADPPAWGFALQPDQAAPRGSRVQGWIPSGTGWERGVNAPITSPTSSTVFQMEVFAPSGHVSGHAVVAYYPPDGTVWVGQSPVEINTGSGWYLLDASTPNFSWSHYTNGTFDGDGGSGQLAAFAQAHGGDANGARLGFTLGCDGNAFYYDNLVVGPAGQSRIFDFEGYQTQVILNKTPKCSLSVPTFPAKQQVSGTLAWHKANGKWVGQAGKISLSGKGAGKIKSSTADQQGRWSAAIQPKKPVKVVAEYAGDATDSGDRSSAQLVRVFPKIEVKQQGRQIHVGQKMVVSGRITPAARHKITVLSTPWTKKRGWGAMKPALRLTTDSQGRYRVEVTAKTVGYQAIDILTGSSKKSSSAISRNSAVFEVKPKPKKSPPHQSGGSAAPPVQGSTDGDSEQGSSDGIETGGYDNGSDDPGIETRGHDHKVKGYGSCRWRKVGNPDKRTGAREESFDSTRSRSSQVGAPESPDFGSTSPFSAPSAS